MPIKIVYLRNSGHQVRSAGGPDPGPGVGPGRPQGSELGGADPVQHPIRGRLRGDRAEQRCLITQRSQVGQAVPTVGEVTARSVRTRPGRCTGVPW